MLDGGPSRTNQSMDRRSSHRPEAVRRAPEELRPAAPVASHQPSPARQSKKANQPKLIERFIKPLVIIIVILVLAAAGWLLWNNSRGFGSTIDPSKYQAVFLSGGEVYFGKLKTTGSDSLVLDDVYYLKSSSEEGGTDNPQDSEAQDATSSSLQLVKLGNEIHNPEDQMEISREQVLYIENLKTDSQVTKLMENQKASN